MHGDNNRWALRCVLFLILSVPAVLAYGGTCDQPAQFKNGLLSIQSNGCSLQQVLQSVQDQAGIEVEIPASAARVPVIVKIEPTDPAAAINSLLHGTSFNYYVVGGERTSVARVVVTEVSAPTAPTVQPPAATQVATASPKAVAATEPAKRKAKKKKEEVIASDEIINNDDEPQGKPELDESTLKKLPRLPPGIPAMMWRMYPEIVQNGGVAPRCPTYLIEWRAPTPTTYYAWSTRCSNNIVLFSGSPTTSQGRCRAARIASWNRP